MTTGQWDCHDYVFGLSLCLAMVLHYERADEDDGDFVRMADCAVGVEQSVAQLDECGSPMKDQVVAEFDLREEQSVLTARLLTLSLAEERSEAGKPFLAAA